MSQTHPRYLQPDPSDYVVVDVETNGLDEETDDLLSISFYKPDEGRVFDRFLPLEKNDAIDPEAAQVNGIRAEDLEGLEPLSQGELDQLISDFELDRRLVLAYGGGNFDERFLRRYIREHGLRGFDRVRFRDFKKLVFCSGHAAYPASKDNLCRAFGIGGVEDVHSSANDCVLEWQLFERMAGEGLLIVEGEVYRLARGMGANPGFLYPALWLDTFSRLRKFSGLPRHHVLGKVVYELELSADATSRSLCLQELRNDVCGTAVRGVLGELLGVDAGLLGPAEGDPSVESWLGTEGRGFLSADLGRLEHVGSLAEVGATYRDGMAPGQRGAPLTRLEPRHLDALSALREELGPLVDRLGEVFGEGGPIRAGQLQADESQGVCARSDFGNDAAVLTVKVGGSGLKPARCSNQLHYGSHGRRTYLLGIDWGGDAGEEAEARPTRFVLRRIHFKD